MMGLVANLLGWLNIGMIFKKIYLSGAYDIRLENRQDEHFMRTFIQCKGFACVFFSQSSLFYTILRLKFSFLAF